MQPDETRKPHAIWAAKMTLSNLLEQVALTWPHHKSKSSAVSQFHLLCGTDETRSLDMVVCYSTANHMLWTQTASSQARLCLRGEIHGGQPGVTIVMLTSPEPLAAGESSQLMCDPIGVETYPSLTQMPEKKGALEVRTRKKSRRMWMSAPLQKAIADKKMRHAVLYVSSVLYAKKKEKKLACAPKNAIRRTAPWSNCVPQINKQY